MSASSGEADAATEDIWNNIKTGVPKTTEEVCGHTVGIAKPDGGMSTWKRPLAFKAWKTGKGTRASYDAAKHTARHAVHHAHQEER